MSIGDNIWNVAALVAGTISVCLAVSNLVSRASTSTNRRGTLRRPIGSKPVRVILLRHAETQNNKRSTDMSQGKFSNSSDDTPQRSNDPALTELGIRQSTAVAQFLQNNIDSYGITVMYCSPMLKTLQTLKPIANALEGKIPFRVNIDLFERGGSFNGERSMTESQRERLPLAHGLNWRQIKETVPQLRFEDIEDSCRYNEWGPDSSQGWWPGRMETPSEYASRIRRVAEWIFSLEENALILAHGKMFDTLVKCLVVGQVEEEIENTVHFLHAGCSITTLDISDAGIAFMSINQQIIAPELRTGHAMEKFELKEVDVASKKAYYATDT